MDLNKLNPNFEVKKLSTLDAHEVYEMCKMNKTYYEFVPPMVTIDSICEDMKRLPPNTKEENKYYLGLYEFGFLLGVIDLILDYPSENCAFIGFFMIHKAYQNYGIGTSIIKHLCDYLSMNGFTKIKLGVVTENKIAERFWKKQGFEFTGIIAKEELYDVMIYTKEI